MYTHHNPEIRPEWRSRVDHNQLSQPGSPLESIVILTSLNYKHPRFVPILYIFYVQPHKLLHNVYY